jgi:ubiquinone/menaquinone biosynthesis C-methylase UbiE
VESLAYFHWRCDQYPGYLDLMPVAGFDGADILDYGCGPGHDLVGFAEYSKPRRLVGADVSSSSLDQARERLSLHGAAVEWALLDPVAERLPFGSGSFDYVHSSDVLHHVPNLPGTLAELRRVLRPEGRLRVMVYHSRSVWLHLYVAYVLRLRDGQLDRTLPIREAFARSTDGAECPIANCYTPEEFGALAEKAGFTCRTVGVACSLFEMQLLATNHFEACMSMELEAEHRQFLLALTYDEQRRPHFAGVPAGVDLVLELTPR